MHAELAAELRGRARRAWYGDAQSAIALRKTHNRLYRNMLRKLAEELRGQSEKLFIAQGARVQPLAHGRERIDTDAAAYLCRASEGRDLPAAQMRKMLRSVICHLIAALRAER